MRYVRFKLAKGKEFRADENVEPTDRDYYTTIKKTNNNDRMWRKAIKNLQQRLMVTTGVKACYIDIDPRNITFETIEGK